MAYNGTSSSQEMTIDTADRVAGLGNITMAAWVRRPVTNSIQTFGFSASTVHRFTMQVWSDNNFYVSLNNGFPFGSIGTVTGWIHVAATFNGTRSNTDRIRLFLNGSQISSSGSVSDSVLSSAANLGLFRVNRALANGVYGDGGYAEIGMWNTDLTAREILALARRFTPAAVRPSSLVSYLPLVRDLIDTQNRRAITNAGMTLTRHPAIIP